MIRWPPSVTNGAPAGSTVRSGRWRPRSRRWRSTWRRPNGLTSTGIGIFVAEPLDALLGRDDGDAAPGGVGDDLLAQQGPAPPLDHPEGAVDLIGAVEVEVERVDLVEVAEGNAERTGEGRCRLAGGDADELEPFASQPACRAAGPSRWPSCPSQVPPSSRSRPARPPLPRPGSSRDRSRPWCYHCPRSSRVGRRTFSLGTRRRVRARRSAPIPGRNRGDQIRTGDLLLPRQAR